MQYDLLLRGGRVIDPLTGLDAVRDIAFAGGKVAAIDSDIPADHAKTMIDARGGIVTPGLIDLHTHVYWGGTSLGVDADRIAAQSGTTTFIDAGSAGAGNFLGFRCHVMERSKVRILAYLNISFAGIFGFSGSLMVGECGDIRLCDPREAVACGREHAEVIVGMKVRSGRIAGGNSGIAPVDLALEAADKLQLPLMAHIDHPPPGRNEFINRLRAGDILTHCFKPFPNAPIDGRGHIRADARAARERGIVFDIGHGMGSIDFAVAEAMLREGIAPNVISSDVHLFCVEGPAFDILVCLSKFLALGIPLVEIIRAATEKPAAAIGRPDLGTLAVGSIGDAALLRILPGRFTFADVVGQTLIGDQRIVSDGIVVAGRWWPNDGPSTGPDITKFTPQAYQSHTEAIVGYFGHSKGHGDHA
jgi:dihydroorotase